MSVPDRLALTAAALVALVGVQLPAPASAAPTDPAPGNDLCASDAARGAVATGFGVDACVDTSAIWLRNQLSAPVRLVITGASHPAAITTAATGTAAILTRTVYPDPTILLPGDVARIPIGDAAASVSLVDSGIGGFYAEAVRTAEFLPPGIGLDAARSVATALGSVVDANATYTGCLGSANWLSQMGCDLSWKSTVRYLTEKITAVGATAGVRAALVDFGGWATTVADHAAAIAPALKAGALTQTVRPAPPPAEGDGGEGTDQGTAGGSAQGTDPSAGPTAVT